MILMSTYFLGESPFKTIYLHGLVRDEEGRKMSKSLDNIINPLDVIAEYGTDAMRLGLMSGITPGNDLRLGDEKIIAMRNFVNKLWNISRYVQAQEISDDILELRTPTDHFIANRFVKTCDAVTKHLEQYNLSLAIEALREFTITDFADWYLEIHKQEKNTVLLRGVFQELITLWHPFLPFVTESIQQEIFDANELLLVRDWPSVTTFPKGDEEQVSIFENSQNLVTKIRTIRNNYNVPAKDVLDITFDTAPKNVQALFNLARVKTTDSVIEKGVTITAGTITAELSLGESVNIENEKKRMENEISIAKNHLSSLTAKLQNKKFISSAPENIKLNTEKLAVETKEKINTLTSALNQLG